MSQTVQALDPLTAALSGISLIEASAGTGKTYTIAALYLRLVLEAGQRVDQILVVTFTNAATEELKDRIRRRLVEARSAFVSGISDDAFISQLLAREADPERAIKRLDNAVRGFDEAAIFTIHGFCQRVLVDRAFASGMPFETELMVDTRALLQEISEDFWRSHFYTASPLLVAFLLEEQYTPHKFLQEIKPYLGKPYLRLERVSDPADFAATEQAFTTAFQQLQDLWPSVKPAVTALLLDNSTLNGNQYRKKSMPTWFKAMDEYLDSLSPNLSLFSHFAKFTSSQIETAAKKNCQPPTHPFFGYCEVLLKAHTALADHYQLYLKALRADLLEYANRELEQRKNDRQAQSYDDLLMNLHKALKGKLRPILVEAIRARYPAALIDEFQDTDPLQYTIFREIYAEAELPVFFVGDPKQAIYSFRGADVFAYLGARDDASAHYTLAVNWRSDPALITAVNTLFGATEQPFLFDEIPFQPAQAADRLAPRLTVAGDPESPLRMWFLATAGDDRDVIGKGEAGERAARATAEEIARLLNAANAGQATLDGTPLAGGDIAVLVRTHRQGMLIRRHLLSLGVPSVQRSQDSVFYAREAQELEWVMRAIVEPGREVLVRAALATELLGLNGADLYRLGEDESAWEQQLERFHDYHQLWREQGFVRLFRGLTRDCGIAQRLLAFADGERRLTNFLHLAELLQEATTRQRLGMEGLLKWLADRRQLDSGEVEAEQLRLESDEHLVQIVTVHKSKGLEYPVVFCPFLWDGRLRSEKSDALSFHDPKNHYEPVLDLGSEQLEQRRNYARNEELAENLRLLYVALTRAKNRCYLVWGKINEAGASPLAWLLHRPAVIDPNSDIVTAVTERYQSMTAMALWAELERQVAPSAGAIRVEALPEPTSLRYQAVLSGQQAFAARHFNGPVRGRWRVSSFSGLTVQHGSETPDYDGAAWTEPGAAVAAADSIFAFPRGARAGRCLHQVFEHWDFSRLDRSELDTLVAKALAEHSFELDWTATVADMVERVLTTPLAADSPALATISPAHRLNELEFYYPLAGLTPEGLRRICSRHGYATGPLRETIDSLSFSYTQGYMKGYIDLVFEAQGRYYLVDYKSNWLGVSLADYHTDKLAEAMARESYHLQYLIYLIALHRYLKLRLPHYDYERHFGGVFYLFLRGITADAPDHGIFRDRPGKGFIEALDAYLASGYVD